VLIHQLQSIDIPVNKKAVCDTEEFAESIYTLGCSDDADDAPEPVTELEGKTVEEQFGGRIDILAS
jgi:hypothetical protein